MNSELIVGLDVGTTKVVVIVGQMQEGMIQITGIGRALNSGMRKGSVVDIEDTVSSISHALEEAETSSGVAIESCIASINGNQVVSVDSKGVVAVSRADGQIQPSDVERVIDSARSVALPPNFEIIHIIPKSFTVDSQAGIKDPTGMSGIRLESITHVVGVSTPVVKNLSRAITQSGVEIEGIVFAPIAAAKAFLSKKQKEIGTVLIDIGSSSTAMAVYEEGTLLHTKVIQIGSNHITNDIAIGLKISLDAAEKIKLNEVNADADEIKESEKLDLGKYEKGEKEKPTKKYISEIVDARLNELFGLVKEELIGIERDELLPAGAVLIGGGAKLSGIQQYAKKILNLPVQIGHPVFEVSGIIDKLDDPEYATAAGLLLWGIDENSKLVSNKPRADIGFEKLGGALDKIKSIFKNIIP